MPKIKRINISNEMIAKAYAEAGTVAGTARLLNVSYPTAQKWLSTMAINIKPQGYNQPILPVTGAQIRHIREFLGFTRDDIVKRVGVSKTAQQTFELNKKTMRLSQVQKLMDFYMQSGIEFKSDGTWTAIIKQCGDKATQSDQ